MTITTNISGSKIVLLAVISTSVMGLPYEIAEYSDIAMKPNDVSKTKANVSEPANWNYPGDFTNRGTYHLDTDFEKLDIIVRFSKQLIDQSKQLDGDIIDMVNENFWDLL